MPLNLATDRRTTYRQAFERNLGTFALSLTSNCNLACKMCSIWNRREHGVAYDKAISLLNQARALGATRFIPCGGEIFIRRDTVSILAHAERIGFEQISIVSNGTLLHKSEKMNQLQNMKTLLITISLDGPREVHDDLRGNGVYDLAVETLRELKDRGITTSISSIIMRQTIDRLEAIVDLAADLGIPVISMQPYQRETAGLDNDHAAFEFRPEEERSLRIRLTKLLHYAKKKNIIVYTANMMDRVPEYLTRGITNIPYKGCFVPSRMLLVDTSGETYPCFLMQRALQEKSMGNVNDHSLDSIWHNDIHKELILLGLNRKCPRCLAACSDIESYDGMSRKSRLSEWIRHFIRQPAAR